MTGPNTELKVKHRWKTDEGHFALVESEELIGVNAAWREGCGEDCDAETMALYELARLAARVERLEGALRHYADEDTWYEPVDASDLRDLMCGFGDPPQVYNYEGDPKEKARAALEDR